VGHCPFKHVEGVGGLSSQSDGFIAFTDGYRFDRARILLFGNFKRQGSSLLNFSGIAGILTLLKLRRYKHCENNN
jgi:hypothetical protein